MNFDSIAVKLVIVAIALLLIIAPSGIDSGPTVQSRAEQLVSSFLAEKGSYMAIYFSDIDTAFTTWDEEAMYKELSKKVEAYRDSTTMFSHIDVSKADSFYATYKMLNLRKDSFRIHFTPRPLGYLILHHFQFDGHPWTDSFVIDFNLRTILKVKETIE